jgi:hypothetical protein
MPVFGARSRLAVHNNNILQVGREKVVEDSPKAIFLKKISQKNPFKRI